jgi:predicted ATPase with chaperone activity
LNEQNRILGLDHFYLCGELALSGELRPVKGTLAIALKSTQAASSTIVHRCKDKGN